MKTNRKKYGGNNKYGKTYKRRGNARQKKNC